MQVFGSFPTLPVCREKTKERNHPIIAEKSRIIEFPSIDIRFKVKNIIHTSPSLVFTAKRFDNNQMYVLKTLPKTTSDSALQEEWQEQFCWEIYVSLLLGKHPNIVQALWAWEDNRDYPYLILEYIPERPPIGSTLRDYIEYHRIQERKIPFPQILKTGIEIAAALIHAQKVFRKELQIPFVHRDLKPENLLLTKDNSVKISDFGMVMNFDNNGSYSEKTIDPSGDYAQGSLRRYRFGGTAPYMAPEQWLNEEPDERTDAYALGCILYEMIEGRPAFLARKVSEYRNKHLTYYPPALSRKIPSDFERLVFRCLAKEKSERPSFEEIMELLQQMHIKCMGCTVHIPDETDNFSSEEWGWRGNGFMFLQKHTEAIQCYEMAIREEEDHRWLNNIGVIYGARLGDYEKGIYYLDRSTRAKPSYSVAYNNKALIYTEQGKYSDALSNINKAIKYRKEPQYYVLRAKINERFGEFEAARDDYTQAINLKEEASTYKMRAMVFCKLSLHDKAINDLQRALHLTPSYKSAEIKKIKRMIEEIKSENV